MVTIKEVAKKAGVSIATISRYFRGTAKVSPETAEKIRRVSQEMGYTPDFFASALKTTRSQFVCCLIPSTNNLFINSITDSLEKSMQSQQYDVMLALTYEDHEIQKKYIQTFLSLRASAFLYIPDSRFAEDYEIFNKNDIYSLQLFLDINKNVDSLTVDDAYGTQIAVEQFIKNGYTNVVMIDFANENFFKNRTKGFIAAFEKHGLCPPYTNLVSTTNETLEKNIENILNKYEHPAILAVGNQIGTETLKQIYERDMKIKKDVSIIIYDDMDIAELMNITCIGHNKAEITENITEMMLNGIKHTTNGSHKKVEKRVIKPFLIDRGSV